MVISFFYTFGLVVFFELAININLKIKSIMDKLTEDYSFEESLNNWVNDEKIANEFITILSKLFYDKSVELIAG